MHVISTNGSVTCSYKADYDVKVLKTLAVVINTVGSLQCSCYTGDTGAGRIVLEKRCNRLHCFKLCALWMKRSECGSV